VKGITQKKQGRQEGLLFDAEESVYSCKFCMRVYQTPLAQKGLAKLEW